jgi:hypothetical protein
MDLLCEILAIDPMLDPNVKAGSVRLMLGATLPVICQEGKIAAKITRVFAADEIASRALTAGQDPATGQALSPEQARAFIRIRREALETQIQQADHELGELDAQLDRLPAETPEEIRAQLDAMPEAASGRIKLTDADEPLAVPPPAPEAAPSPPLEGRTGTELTDQDIAGIAAPGPREARAQEGKDDGPEF